MRWHIKKTRPGNLAHARPFCVWLHSYVKFWLPRKHNLLQKISVTKFRKWKYQRLCFVGFSLAFFFLLPFFSVFSFFYRVICETKWPNFWHYVCLGINQGGAMSNNGKWNCMTWGTVPIGRWLSHNHSVCQWQRL